MHLYDLKAAIYDTPYKNVVSDTSLDGFELISDNPLHYEIYLSDPDVIRNLFMMTPYAYRTKPADRERIFALKRLTCRVHFRVFVYKKL